MIDIKNRYQQRLKAFLDAGLLVPKTEEESYAKKHNINLGRFKNGAKYVSTISTRDDLKKASVNINFAAGSRYNPIKKDGLAHFLEHLMFSESFDEFFSLNQASINAYTNSDVVRFVFVGDLNFDYPTYSLPAVIDKSFTLIHRLYGLDDDADFISTRETIKNEIENYQANYDRRCMDTFRELIFHKQSSWVIQNLGTKKSLDRITKQDILDYHKKYFGSQNILVSALVEADKRQFDMLNKKLTDIASAVDKEANENTPEVLMYDVINDSHKFNTGKVIKKSLDIKNGLITTIGYIKFTIPMKQGVEQKALYIVGNVLADKIFQLSRVEGLSYRVNSSYFQTVDDDFIILVSSIDGNTDWDKKFAKFKNFVENFLNNTNKYQYLFKNELEMEKIRQLATPLSQAAILDYVTGGLRNYDHMRNVDIMLEQYRAITMNHVDYVLGQMKNLTPNYLCVGDIK